MSTSESPSPARRNQSGASKHPVLCRTARVFGPHPVLVGVVGTAVAMGLMSLVVEQVQVTLGDAMSLVLAITLGAAFICATWFFAFVLRDQVSNEERLKQLSMTDALTGLANRRALKARITREWVKARRGGTPLSILFIDIDFFKRFNDTLGHVAGDVVLTAVANCIQGVARRSVDFVARYGGEEFVVVLPRVTAEGATIMAAAIRDAVRAMQLHHDTSEHRFVTVSVGGATCNPGDGTKPSDLVEAADAQMYAAKQAGRNRVRTVELR